MINRRGLITGLISFIAAPAIVRASSLMPVKAMKAIKLTDYKALFNETADVCYGRLHVGDWISFGRFDTEIKEFVITAISEKDIYVNNT